MIGRKRTYASRSRSQSQSGKKKKQRTLMASSWNQKIMRPLGRMQKMVHKYSEKSIVLDPGLGGTLATHVFSANGLYDPDITGVGHQVIGFDEITNFFDHYTTLWAKIDVAFDNTETTRGQMVGIFLKDTSTPYNGFTNAVENGQGKWAYCDEADTGNGVRRISLCVDVGKFLGRPNPLNEDDLRGNSGSNPTEQAYFHLCAEPRTATDTQSVICFVDITYIAAWTEPTTLAQS